jgi:hypothetical protein
MRRYQLLVVLIFVALVAVGVNAQVPLETWPFWRSTETDVYSTGMVWRDSNLDGFIDGFFSNGNDMALARNFVYISSNGTLPTSATWQSNDLRYSGHCAVGDINDDGYPDLAVANYIGTGGFPTAEHSVLYLNNGGLLNSSPDWWTINAIYSFSCAMGDVDGDGDLDLAFATGEGYTDVYTPDIVHYNVNGSLQGIPGWQTSENTASLDVAWGDVDNDGDLDIAFCYDYRPTSVYYNNGGTLETEPSWQSGATYSGNTLIWGDVNGDGWLDLVVAYNNQLAAGGYFQAYLNDGAGQLDPLPFWRASDGGYGSALAMYDYDGDGDDDLAAGRWFDRPRIYENIGGTFTTDPVWRADISTAVEELAWVDIDGDGVRPFTDTFYTGGSTKLFYTSRHPLHAVDSVLVDGGVLPLEDYCYDMFYGWVSLGQVPSESVVVYYQHSEKCDLTVANWGAVNDAYANTTSCCGQYNDGYTGNANCSEDGKLSLADIARLIDRVYISKQPLCCEPDGNTDGGPDGLISLSDITRLIDAVYISKGSPEPCL